MAFLQKLFGRGRGEGAEPTAAPASVSAAEWLQRGNAALQDWKLDEAARCYEHATAIDPADPVARMNSGFVALEQGDAASAIALLQQALALRRDGDTFVADAHFLLGRAYRQQAADDQALLAFEAALSARPDFAEALEEGFALLHAQQRFDQALAWAERLDAIRSSPASALEVARALAGLDRHEEALAKVDGVLAAQPRDAQAWTGRGHILLSQRRAEEALSAFRKALEIVGPTPPALANEAKALARAGRHEEAVHRYRELLQAEPGNAALAADLMAVLIEMSCLREAIAVGEEALRQDPENAEIHWTLSAPYLLLGELERGWREYEWRRRARSAAIAGLPDFGRKRWLGEEDLAGKTLLLAPEQGLGDTIQFLRYVPQVAARAGKVLVSVTEELHELVATAGLPANCVVVPPGGTVDSFDLQTSLMSLPLALGPGEAIPAEVPYLRADPQRVDAWRRRLASHGDKLRVGVSWSGNPGHANDHNRSIPLDLFRSLEAAGCCFVSLQPQVRERDRDAMAAWPELLPWGAELSSFMDTAALMEALDMIVAVDTSVVHLAGALGRPTRVLLPHLPDWRWMLGREDTPWYPTARLYRQERPGDWTGVLARVRLELQQLAADRSRRGVSAPSTGTH